MRTLLIAFAFAACGAVAAEPVSFQAGAAQPAVHPARYSFADVYRLTLAGPIADPALSEASLEAPVRVAATQAQAGEPRFSVAPPRQPAKWLLILAGLSLAGWVAHRRLAHAL